MPEARRQCVLRLKLDLSKLSQVNTQLTFTCSKETIETFEKDVRYVQT